MQYSWFENEKLVRQGYPTEFYAWVAFLTNQENSERLSQRRNPVSDHRICAVSTTNAAGTAAPAIQISERISRFCRVEYPLTRLLYSTLPETTYLFRGIGNACCDWCGSHIFFSSGKVYSLLKKWLFCSVSWEWKVLMTFHHPHNIYLNLSTGVNSGFYFLSK